MIRGESFECPLLQQLKKELFDEHGNVLEATRSLGMISWCANLRRHGLLFIVYLVFAVRVSVGLSHRTLVTKLEGTIRSRCSPLV